MYRLFRDATRYEDGHHVKDLGCINRDLSKVIVIDWNSQSVRSHPRNALKIKEWKGNDDDRTLIDLALLLKSESSLPVFFFNPVLILISYFYICCSHCDVGSAGRERSARVLQSV